MEKPIKSFKCIWNLQLSPQRRIGKLGRGPLTFPRKEPRIIYIEARPTQTTKRKLAVYNAACLQIPKELSWAHTRTEKRTIRSRGGEHETIPTGLYSVSGRASHGRGKCRVSPCVGRRCIALSECDMGQRSHVGRCRCRFTNRPSASAGHGQEIVEIQNDVTLLLQGQRDMQNSMSQNQGVVKTMLQQSIDSATGLNTSMTDSVNKLNTSMGALQKSVQDVQANSGARLDTLSTSVQGFRTISTRSGLASAK